MTDINHRRKNKKPVNQRFGEYDYNNGFAAPNNKRHLSEVKADHDKWCAEMITLGLTPAQTNPHTGSQRIGRTDYLDKSMHGWGKKSQLADKSVGASIGNDFTNGHRGMAKAVRGAKKFVRSRIRFSENAATKKLAEKDLQDIFSHDS